MVGQAMQVAWVGEPIPVTSTMTPVQFELEQYNYATRGPTVVGWNIGQLSEWPKRDSNCQDQQDLRPLQVVHVRLTGESV
eukprot:1442770-Rhodomonas_salina.2